MKYFTRSLLFCLLCGGLFSCLEDSEQTLIISPGSTEVITTGDDPNSSTNFKFGYNDVEISHAYVRTIALPDGETFEHHVVLTSTDVLESGDLRSGEALPTAALLLQSGSSTPAGEYLFSEGTLVDAGSEARYPVSQGSYLLRNLPYDSGSSVTITAQGDEYTVEVNLLNNSNPGHTFRGTYTGPLVAIAAAAQEIGEEEFSGENFMRRDAESFSLTNAYLVPYGSYYRLYLSDAAVHQETELSGTSNVTLIQFSRESDGNLRTGRYGISNDAFRATGYFDSILRSTINSSFFCRDMNFTSNTAADDEQMITGETLIRVDGDTFSIKFDYLSYRDGHVQGEYHGQVMRSGF